jgi:hypothetical protein
MISKIKRRSDETNMEIQRGEKIKQIPNYEYRFAPIENHTEIKMAGTKTEMIQCHERNVGNTTLEEYIHQSKRKAETASLCEEYLRESIRQMNDAGIYHLNFNNTTIVMDEINHVPIIRGFGAATASAATVPIQMYSALTYSALTYPIEYYILNSTDEIFTEETAEDAFHQFYHDKPIFDKKHQTITDTELIEMKERYNIYTQPMVGKPMKQIKKNISKNTWDQYMLSVFLLDTMDGNHEWNNTEQEEKQKKMILSLPNERPRMKDRE